MQCILQWCRTLGSQRCLRTQQELRQRIRHLSYGHGRAVIKLKQDADAALHAAAEADSRQRLEDYQEKAALRRLGREQVRACAVLSASWINVSMTRGGNMSAVRVSTRQ